MALDYKTSIVIDLPSAKVIELFDDPANLAKWQRGFQSFEPISGVPGQPGAKSKLVYQMGKRRMEMIETITRRCPMPLMAPMTPKASTTSSKTASSSRGRTRPSGKAAMSSRWAARS